MKKIIYILISLTLLSCSTTLLPGKHKMYFVSKKIVPDNEGVLYEYRIENEKRFIEFTSYSSYYLGDSIYVKR